MASPLALLLATLTVAVLSHSALAYVPDDATRYAPGLTAKGVNIPPKPEFALTNFTRQWTASMELARREPGKDPVFKAHKCNATTWGGACNKDDIITQNSNHLIRINFARRNVSAPFRTYSNWPVKYVIVRMGIMVATAEDRGWRKKNGLYPKYGQHVLIKSEKLPADIQSGSVVFDMNEEDELPTVVIYPEVCAVCIKPDGKEEYCQCDRWHANSATAQAQSVETEAVMGITDPMRAAAIALSVISPMIFFLYWGFDNIYYKKTGRPFVVPW